MLILILLNLMEIDLTKLGIDKEDYHSIFILINILNNHNNDILDKNDIDICKNMIDKIIHKYICKFNSNHVGYIHIFHELITSINLFYIQQTYEHLWHFIAFFIMFLSIYGTQQKIDIIHCDFESIVIAYSQIVINTIHFIMNHYNTWIKQENDLIELVSELIINIVYLLSNSIDLQHSLEDLLKLKSSIEKYLD